MQKPSPDLIKDRSDNDNLQDSVAAVLFEQIDTLFSGELNDVTLRSLRGQWKANILTIIETTERRVSKEWQETPGYKIAKEKLIEMEVLIFEGRDANQLNSQNGEFKNLVKAYVKDRLNNYLNTFADQLTAKANKTIGLLSFACGAAVAAALGTILHLTIPTEPEKVLVPVEVEPKPLIDPRDIPEIIRLLRQLFPSVY